MIIRGGNLGKKENVEYKNLSEWSYFPDGRQELVKKIEQLYLKFLEESRNTDVKLFPQKDGQVNLMPGMLVHKCSINMDSLKGIAKYGILASEWFGYLESEAEGRFCSFISRIHDEDNSKKKGKC